MSVHVLAPGLQATVQEGALTFNDAAASVHVEPVRWK